MNELVEWFQLSLAEWQLLQAARSRPACCLPEGSILGLLSPSLGQPANLKLNFTGILCAASMAFSSSFSY